MEGETFSKVFFFRKEEYDARMGHLTAPPNTKRRL